MTGKDLVRIIVDNNLLKEEVLEDSVIRFTDKAESNIAYQTVHTSTLYFDTDVPYVRPGEITFCLKSELD